MRTECAYSQQSYPGAPDWALKLRIRRPSVEDGPRSRRMLRRVQPFKGFEKLKSQNPSRKVNLHGVIAMTVKLGQPAAASGHPQDTAQSTCRTDKLASR